MMVMARPENELLLDIHLRQQTHTRLPAKYLKSKRIDLPDPFQISCHISISTSTYEETAADRLNNWTRCFHLITHYTVAALFSPTGKSTHR